MPRLKLGVMSDIHLLLQKDSLKSDIFYEKTLRWYDEMDYEEIARITGMSAGAAKANYHFAKDKIIQYIKEND